LCKDEEAFFANPAFGFSRGMPSMSLKSDMTAFYLSSLSLVLYARVVLP
jgi:hypothetical protein